MLRQMRHAQADLETVEAMRAASGVTIGVRGETPFVQRAPSVKARGRVQFRTLPTGVDVTAAIAELDDRTRRLLTTMADTTERLDDDVEAIRGSVDHLAGRVTTEIGRLGVEDRRVTAGGRGSRPSACSRSRWRWPYR